MYDQMNCIIDRHGAKAAYLQLYEFLKRDIVNGVYGFGSKLPSKRTLAAETGLSVIPVEHALELLYEDQIQKNHALALRYGNFYGHECCALHFQHSRARGTSVSERCPHRHGGFAV